MRLSEYREEYLARSSKTSDIIRQLSFAGLGVIWIFRLQPETGDKIPEYLVWPTILFVTSLGLDLLHAVSGTAIWGIFHRLKEKKRKGTDRDPDIEHSPYLTWPINFFFWTKILVVITGYISLFKFLFRALVS